MASLLDLCEKYFGYRDFYDVLKIPTNANEKQGRFSLFTAINLNLTNFI